MRPLRVGTATEKVRAPQAAADAGEHKRSDNAATVAKSNLQMRRAGANQSGDHGGIRSHIVGEQCDIAPASIIVGSRCP